MSFTPMPISAFITNRDLMQMPVRTLLTAGSINRLLSVLAVVIFVSATACSSTPPPTPAGIEGNKTVEALRDLSNMYGKKNYAGFMSMISDRYPERKAFAASIESIFSGYQAVQFTIQFTKMFITVEDRGATKASFNWESSWEKPGGSILRNSGRATFVFESNEAKLVAIDGKNPFIPQQIEQEKQ